MKLYGVSYKWMTFIDKVSMYAEKYTVVAADEVEAESKARALLLQSSMYDYTKPEDDKISTNVYERKSTKLSLPQLSSAEDQEKFKVKVRISRDGKNLEFLVKEK